VEQQREYVGIDLHRRRSVIVRITESGKVLGRSVSTTTRSASCTP
jgi:hypothetical protein